MIKITTYGYMEEELHVYQNLTKFTTGITRQKSICFHEAVIVKTRIGLVPEAILSTS